jgi:NAD+ diphosphatase
MSKPIDHFRHCPACGHPLQAPPLPNALRCSACDFLYFFNPTVATGVILSRPDGAVLFIRRAKEPERGKLALPGGFIEMGETAEVSLRREVSEEVGLTIGPLEYLCSAVNAYEYHSVTYPVLDFFFTAQVSQTAEPEALDDVAAISWLHPALVSPDQIAFPSVRAAVRLYSERVVRLSRVEVAGPRLAAPTVPSGPPPGNRIA